MQSKLPYSELPGAKVTDIHWNDQRRVITIRNRIIALTPSEYRLLLPLRHGLPVTYSELALAAYNYALDERVQMLMNKQIHRIRGKLRGSDFYIYCVHDYGYILLPTPLPPEF